MNNDYPKPIMPFLFVSDGLAEGRNVIPVQTNETYRTSTRSLWERFPSSNKRESFSKSNKPFTPTSFPTFRRFSLVKALCWTQAAALQLGRDTLPTH